MRFFIIFLIIIICIFNSQRLQSISILNDFQFNTDGDLEINQNAKTIYTNGAVLIKNNYQQFSSSKLKVWYQDLKKLNLEHVNKIEANGNVVIRPDENTNITADRYVYSLISNVHVLISLKNPVVYKTKLNTLTSKDRIEYFLDKNVIVIRGNPEIIGKASSTSATEYKFNAKLINVQLNNTVNSINNNLIFVEAIDNVSFIQNNTHITANYAIYYKETEQIEFYNNVKFSTNGSTLLTCSAIYNLKLGFGKIVPCSENSEITGNYQPQENINNEKK